MDTRQSRHSARRQQASDRQLEAGEANPSHTTLLAVANGFDLVLAELVSIDDSPAVTVNDRAVLFETARRLGRYRTMSHPGWYPSGTYHSFECLLALGYY